MWRFMVHYTALISTDFTIYTLDRPVQACVFFNFLGSMQPGNLYQCHSANHSTIAITAYNQVLIYTWVEWKSYAGSAQFLMPWLGSNPHHCDQLISRRAPYLHTRQVHIPFPSHPKQLWYGGCIVYTFQNVPLIWFQERLNSSSTWASDTSRKCWSSGPWK